MNARLKTEADELLRAFFDEPDESKSQELLAELISAHAEPLIRRVLGAKLRTTRESWDAVERQDLEDLNNEIILQLLRRINKIKSGDKLIETFQSYVAVTTYNACNSYLRRKYPERSRLKAKLRYALTTHNRLALWQNGSKTDYRIS